MSFSTNFFQQSKNRACHVLGMVLFGSLLFAGFGCESPFVNSRQPISAGQEVGEVELSIPHISSYLSEALGSLNQEGQLDPSPASRAFLIADQVEIDLFDSDDTLLDTITILVESNQPGSGKARFALAAGTGYYLHARVFNTDSDPSTPVVQGVSSPFDVASGEMTQVNVFCLPSNPIILEDSVASPEIDLVPTTIDSMTNQADMGGEAWFAFTPQTQWTNFSLIQTESVLSSQYLFLFDPEGNYLCRLTPYSPSPYVLIATNPGETYYAAALDLDYPDQVFSGRFKVLFRPHNEIVPYEPNDTIADATPISLGESQTHSFFTGDSQDVLSIYLEEGQYVNIKTSMDEIDMDTYIRLDEDDDPDNGHLSSDDDTYDPITDTNGFSSLNYMVQETRTYYIIIENWGSEDIGTFHLTADLVPPYLDGNTDPTEALTMNLDETINGSISALSDRDYFSIDTVHGQGYIISFDTGTNSPMLATLRNEDGLTITSAKQDTELNFIGTGETYVLDLSTLSNGFSYEVTLSERTYAPDSLESNDTGQDATPYVLGDSVSTEIYEPGDVDVFSTSLMANQRYVLYIYSYPYTLDWMLSDDPEFSNIILSSSDPFQPYFIPESSGDHYLAFYSESAQVFSYDFEVEHTEVFQFTLEVEGLMVDPGEYIMVGDFYIDPWDNSSDRRIDVDVHGNGSLWDSSGENLRVTDTSDAELMFSIVQPGTWNRPWHWDSGQMGNRDDFGAMQNFLVQLEIGENPQHIKLVWDGEGSMVNIYIDDILHYPNPLRSNLPLQTLVVKDPMTLGLDEALYEVALDPALTYTMYADQTLVLYYTDEEEMRTFGQREWELNDESITGYSTLYIRAMGRNASSTVFIQESVSIDSFGIIGTAVGDGTTDLNLASSEDGVYAAFAELTAGGFRFRANGNWDDLVFGIDPLGSDLIESSTSDDIVIAEDGLYLIHIDFSSPFDLEHSIIKVDTIGITGDHDDYATTEPMNILGTTFTWTGYMPWSEWYIIINDDWVNGLLKPESTYMETGIFLEAFPFYGAYSSLSSLTIYGSTFTCDLIE